VRAVASACATNPVALAIPCHRVVQKGGALAGYRWGLPRKAALLDAESQHAKNVSSDETGLRHAAADHNSTNKLDHAA
jgi:AraC family transcriptional regulator of adaptative response/methylated-DNA-[protein]-cysteine methyltransferase